MAPLLGRKYRLTFGRPGTQGRVVTGLNVSFDIEKTTSSKANSATITVYNLNAESRAALEDPESVITLEAGYESQFGIVFTGNDLIVQTRKVGVDNETTIKSKDGGKQIAETHVNLDVPAGEGLEETVNKIVRHYKDVTGRPVELKKLPRKKAARAKALSKSAAKLLDELLAPEGYEWSIQDGEFRVTKITEGSEETVYILSPQSGLIGSPEKTRFRLPNMDKDSDGISFTCLLNPHITPLRRVQLASENIRGIYKITSVKYRGDFSGSDWYCEAEGIPV